MVNSDTSPVVSIIMPTYNRAACILETIKSIRNQSFENWELIIMDHGSDDNTVELVKQVRDQRIQFNKVARSELLSEVRKAGIEKASGRFIALMDSDDLWGKTKLEEQVWVLEQNAVAGFCITGGYNFREPGIPVEHFYKLREGSKQGNLFNSFFTSELAVYSQALMFRKRCLELVPFKETDNDIDFILRLAKNFDGIILYKPLLFRRLHKMNFSDSIWERNYHKGINAIEANKTGVEKTIVNNALFRLYINYGEDCLKNKEQKKAINNFFKAWKNKPSSIIPFKKTGKAMLQYFKK